MFECNPSEVGAGARAHTEGTNNLISIILGLLETLSELQKCFVDYETSVREVS